MTVTKSSGVEATSGLRAVVVDDSHFMRTVIADLLEDADVTVVDTAVNGSEAVDAVREHRPDVVTMDLKMPGMDGIEAVERIMEETPTPVLVLSAHAGDGAERAFEAMERGAVDVFEKPSGEVSVDIKRKRDALVSKVESTARADVPVASGTTRSEPLASPSQYDDRGFVENPTLLVGASTGGPPVVERLVAELPLAADLRVLVVQHMPEGFTGRFAERLDEASQYSVREATDGTRIGGGEVLVARGDSHMRVSGAGGGRLRVSLDDGPPVNNVRPAIDVTFESAAETVDGPLTAAILTGMGRDGTAGARDVSAAGGRVIAQDEETSAVFGMPRRAIEAGVVDDVRPRAGISTAVLEGITTD